MTKGMAQKSREVNLGPQTSPFFKKISDDSECEMSLSQKEKREKQIVLEVQG
jgi:hypothetical protein